MKLCQDEFLKQLSEIGVCLESMQATFEPDDVLHVVCVALELLQRFLVFNSNTYTLFARLEDRGNNPENTYFLRKDEEGRGWCPFEKKK